MRLACSKTWRAYPRNSSPSGVASIPRPERAKIVMPYSPSTSRIAAVRDGWERKSRFAASVMLPVSAAVTMYCSCRSVTECKGFGAMDFAVMAEPPVRQ